MRTGSPAAPHHPRRAGPTRAGLVLAELLVVMLVVAVALAVLTVAATRSRSNAQLTGSLGNLKQLSAWTFQYTQDAQGLLPGYSRLAGGAFNTDIIAQAAQARDIIRRRANPDFPTQTGWFPQLGNIHLVLADYANLALNDRVLASPGDPFTIGLQDRPDQLPSGVRHPYVCSYEFPPSFYYAGRSLDAGVLENAQNQAIYQYTPGTLNQTVLRQRPISAMTAPARKALIIEQFQWYFGARTPFYMFREARVPIATGDGAVALRSSADAAVGAYSSPPPASNPIPVSMGYSSVTGRPPVPDGLASTLMDGRLRWTNRLLAGRDFGPP